jgi:hypothetical protein
MTSSPVNAEVISHTLSTVMALLMKSRGPDAGRGCRSRALVHLRASRTRNLMGSPCGH